MKIKCKAKLQKSIGLILCVLILFSCFSINISATTPYTPPPSAIDSFGGSIYGFVKIKINKVHDQLYYDSQGVAEKMYGLDIDSAYKHNPYLIVECTVIEALFPDYKLENELTLAISLIYMSREKNEDGELDFSKKYYDKDASVNYLSSCDIVYLNTKALYPLPTKPEKFYTATDYVEFTDCYITKNVTITGSIDVYDFTQLYFIPFTDGSLKISDISASRDHVEGVYYALDRYEGIEEYFSNGLTEAETDENIKRLYEDVLEYERLEAEREAEEERKANRSFLEVILEFFVGIIHAIVDFFRGLFG